MAGTVTESRINGSNLRTVTLTCVGDASDGSFPDTDIEGLREWLLYSVETVPGTTKPTALYDIEIQSSRGTDLMAGNLADRNATIKQLAYPNSKPAMVDGTITQVITNSSVVSANLVIVYQFIK